jgi:hypothetical protein
MHNNAALRLNGVASEPQIASAGSRRAFDIVTSRDVSNCCLQTGMVTLHHFSNPLWLKPIAVASAVARRPDAL